MRYYYLEPEAVGETGDRTIMDASFHPPIVTKLHWLIDHWIGDVLVQLFPCWITTVSAMNQIKLAGLTGVSFGELESTTSEQFREFHPNRRLPEFVWMKVEGTPGHDDFGVDKSYKIGETQKPFDYHRFTLVVSERALDLLQRLGISHATIEDLPKMNDRG
jgi:hypothetical protein